MERMVSFIALMYVRTYVMHDLLLLHSCMCTYFLHACILDMLSKCGTLVYLHVAGST